MVAGFLLIELQYESSISRMADSPATCTKGKMPLGLTVIPVNIVSNTAADSYETNTAKAQAACFKF